MTMIELNGITVVKAGETLFQDFNFRIRKGEHWLISGENGSGKTTLLQLLAGVQTPAEGTIEYSFIKGNDWHMRYKQRQELIHFIPTHWMQSALGGFDDLFYQQRYYAIDDTLLPRVSDILGEHVAALGSRTFSGTFDIRPLLDLPITRLSNGQLKKVIILKQLVRNIPRLLILDYPFDGLDTASRRDLSGFIDRIAAEFGIQIVLSDHGYALPTVLNRRLVLKNFAIEQESDVGAEPAQAVTPRAPTTTSIQDEAVVEMQDLNITYSGKKIISHLNWRINRGERWALTGKNGSGKTTLFSLIYADHPMAYSQKVFLFGKRRGSGESIWDIKNRINYLGPEQLHFLDYKTKSLTGREFILAQTRTSPGSLPELIRFFNAEGYIDMPLRILSSGQLQMVLLMNMFLDNKELLLLDEPFQFLDPSNHERVTAYLNQYLNRDVTLVLITHDDRDVAQWTQLRKVL